MDQCISFSDPKQKTGYRLKKQKGIKKMKKHTPEETRMKISKTLKGRPGHPQTEETRRKISETMKTKTVPEERRRRISETERGKKVSKETCKKISEARKKPLKITDLNTNEVFYFNSRLEAREKLDSQYISYAITHQNGRYKHFLIEDIPKNK